MIDLKLICACGGEQCPRIVAVMEWHTASVEEAEQAIIKRAKPIIGLTDILNLAEAMRDATPPYSADKDNPMKHVYQNQGYFQALDDFLAFT